MSDNEYKEHKIGEEEYYELPAHSSRSMIWSALSLIAGVLSVLTCPLYVLGLILGAVSFALALYSRRRHGFFTRLALFGLILSIVGIVFGVFSMIVSLSGIFG
ncbi:MAG: DUF4190 domain-containing protein [Clostridia bacterium]|nr:DUF4190 domain-containing protein [Clostridia bacterium]